MSSQVSTAAFIKGAFYKTCFCIGLGTASYYSYGQVQNWVAAPSATIAKISAFQEKVDSLIASPSDSASVGLPSSASPSAQNPESAGYRANTKLYFIGDKKSAVAVVAPAAPAAVDPSASPAAAPAAEGEKKEGEVAKEGEKKEGEEAKLAEGVIPGAGTGPVNALGLPYFPAPVAEAQAANPSPQAPAAGGVTGAAQSAANTPSTSGVGGVGAGLPTALANVASGANPVATPSVASNPGETTTTTTSSTVVPPVGALSTTDITQLTGTAIKASFADQTENVSGLVCSIGLDNSANDCMKNNHYAVHTDRWNTSYGLSNEASFSVASSSSTHQVQVEVSLKLQDLNQNFQTISVSVYPSEVLMQTESKNGKLYKVYELKLPDMNALNGDKLTNVVATLVYEESSTGTGAMSSDSALTFSRSRVQTTGTAWDLTGQNRVPAANEQVIVADSLNYTMNLEKSP